MVTALIFSAAAIIFAGLVFRGVFEFITPDKVKVDYDPCGGKWDEAYIHGCEKGLCHIPQQPVNTYSNLAYLAAGVYMHVIVGTNASLVFAITMMYLAVASSLFHATSTKWAGMLDVTAIYVVFSAIAVYAASSVFDGTNWTFTPPIMFVLAGLTSYVCSKRFHRRMNLVIAVFLGGSYLAVLINMAIERDRSAWRYLLASFLLFVIAYGIWNLDRKRIFPIRGWGHGFWHVLTAAASAFVFQAANRVP